MVTATAAITIAPTENTTADRVRLARPAAQSGSARGGAATDAVLISLLIFAGLLLFGANRTDLALAFSGLWFLAAALLLTRGWAREALHKARFGWIALPFGGVLACAIVSLTPLARGGPGAIWGGVGGASAHGSIDPYATVVEVIKLLALAAVFMVGLLFGSDDIRAKSLIRWLLRLGLAYSLWAFYHQESDPRWLFGAPQAADVRRLSASLVSPNTASVLFGALALLDITDLDRKLHRHGFGHRLTSRELERIIIDIARPIIGLATAAACLILTLSRAGISTTMAMVVVLVVGAGAARFRRRGVSAPVLATLALLITVVAISFALNLESLQDRLKFLGDDAVIRRAAFAAHWAAFKSEPLFGYGLGSFFRVNAMIMNGANFGVLRDLGAAHNVYLQWIEQAGVVGSALMFLCIGLIALRVMRGAWRRRRMRAWMVGILAVLALFLGQGLGDFALEVPAMAAFLSLLLGLGCGVAALPSTRDAQDVRRPAPPTV